jgi:hypothetical protein
LIFLTRSSKSAATKNQVRGKKKVASDAYISAARQAEEKLEN